MSRGVPCASQNCACRGNHHSSKLVVITGGPGAGKTAVLEIARRSLCEHVAILPEAASIVFGGGFPRLDSESGKRAGQLAIFHVQRALERMVLDEGSAGIVLCDRGTVDGLAYWNGSEENYWREIGSSKEAEFSRYATVIHLRSPSITQGYNHRNPVRIESSDEAALLDQRIIDAWIGHPRRFIVESQDDFFQKAKAALELIKAELPECCQRHEFENPR